MFSKSDSLNCYEFYQAVGFLVKFHARHLVGDRTHQPPLLQIEDNQVGDYQIHSR